MLVENHIVPQIAFFFTLQRKCIRQRQMKLEHMGCVSFVNVITFHMQEGKKRKQSFFNYIQSYCMYS